MKALLPQPEGGNSPVEFFGLTDEQAENRRFRKHPSGLIGSSLKNAFEGNSDFVAVKSRLEPVSKFRIKQNLKR